MSAWVNTASTPGAAAATAVSICAIRPDGTVAGISTAYATPSISVSAV